MPIQSPKFEELLTGLCLTSPGPEREAATSKLTQFIEAHVMLRRTQAINAFKRACQAQGLIAVRKDGFEQLVKDLEHLPDGDMAAEAQQLRHDVLDVSLPDEDGKPEFTVAEDEDLDRLLNSTAALLSGRANQDVGMAWYEDLQAVLRKLSQIPRVVDPNDRINVEGFDYPTTYADLARLPVEKLWNRFVTGRPYPDAKVAFMVARAIPFLYQVITVPGQWHYDPEFPPDYRPVLAELVPKRKNAKEPVYAVVCYHRTQKGVHDAEPGWFDPRTDDTCEVLRWQYINA
jgi:hypothetical protein